MELPAGSAGLEGESWFCSVNSPVAQVIVRTQTATATVTLWHHAYGRKDHLEGIKLGWELLLAGGVHFLCLSQGW